MFTKLITEIENQHLNVHGIKVYKNNQTVFHHMFHEDIRYPIYSAAKTITSAAVGLAAYEKKLDIYKPLAEYINKKYLLEIPADCRKDFEKIPIKRFLTMSVDGFPFRPDGKDWLKFSLQSCKSFSKPEKFSYSNISAYLVGAACENAVGEPLMDYINRKIFDPLNIANVPFQTDPQGRFYGATGMYLTVSELSLLGQLYLNKGRFQGMQLISESWIEESSKTHIQNKEGGYGYFLWTCGNHYSISGKWGQKCLIYPDKKLVITYMSDMPENSGKMLKIADKLADKL